jgi:hypothetical protein
VITEDQKERLTAHGQTLANLESIINSSSAQLCIEWWEVGKELSDPSYHTGSHKNSIMKDDMALIAQCLGLSTRRSSIGNVGGAVTINASRKFYKLCPSEEDRNRLIARYKTWSEIKENAFHGRDPSDNAEDRDSSQARSNWMRGGGERARRRRRPSSTHPGRLITPHNTRLVWDRAIQEFMAYTGCEYHVAREILFKVMADLDYVQIMSRIWEESYA